MIPKKLSGSLTATEASLREWSKWDFLKQCKLYPSTCNVQSDDGDKAVVLLGHENKHFKSEQVSFLPIFSLFLQQVSPVNPPKFEKCEDMANLTFLSEAAVFWNLKSRYQANIILSAQSSFWLRPSWSIHTRACSVSLWIHTSASPSTPTGWRRCTRWLPHQGWLAMFFLQGKRREETPPHLWAVTETAYRNMLKDRCPIIFSILFRAINS